MNLQIKKYCHKSKDKHFLPRNFPNAVNVIKIGRKFISIQLGRVESLGI